MDKLDIVTLIFQEGRLRGVDAGSDTWTVHCARAVLWDPKSDLPDSKARASSATPHRPESQQCLCAVLWLRPRLVLFLTFGFYLGCCSVVANCVRLLSDPMDCSLSGSSVHGIFQAGVGCHFLLQGTFLTQGLNPHVFCIAGWFFTIEHQGYLPLQTQKTTTCPRGRLVNV